MTGADRQKLNAAGFRIFSKIISSKTIIELKYGTNIKHSGPYESKAAMDRAFDELMQDPKHLSGL